jgi:hypothetical protein
VNYPESRRIAQFLCCVTGARLLCDTHIDTAMALALTQLWNFIQMTLLPSCSCSQIVNTCWLNCLCGDVNRREEASWSGFGEKRTDGMTSRRLRPSRLSAATTPPSNIPHPIYLKPPSPFRRDPQLHRAKNSRTSPFGKSSSQPASAPIRSPYCTYNPSTL